jgi:DNA polymerase-3 subunit beta
MLDAGEVFQLAASDFDTFGTVEVPATIGEPGRCVVSAYLLASLAKTLRRPTDEVSIETSGKGLSLRSGRLRAGLPEMDAEQWQAFPAPDEHLGTVSAPVLARCLSRVLPVVAPPDGKPEVITGVLLDTTQAAVLVATDRYRIAAAELDWRATGATESLVIPAALLEVAGDVMTDGDVVVYSDGSTITLATGRHRVTGRLHAGEYVPWRSVMDVPESFLATVATIDVDDLACAVMQVSSVSTPTAKVPELIRLEIGPDEVGVSLETDTDASGDNGIDLHSITGPPITVGVSHRYLLDALSALGSPKAFLTFTDDPGKQFLCQAADDTGAPLADGYRHLLMTRQLRGAR